MPEKTERTDRIEDVSHREPDAFVLTPEMKREIAQAVVELLARHGLIDRAASRAARDRISNSED